MMETLTLKLIFMVAVFVSASAAGLAPIFFARTCGKRISLSVASRDRILSLASCFSAGVFLFVCFLGLLPAADSKFHSVLEKLENGHTSWEQFASFPWGFFTVTIGFLVIFTLDKVVHEIERFRAEKHSSKDTISTVATDEEGTLPLKLNHNGHANIKIPPTTEIHSHANHSVPSSIMFLIALSVHCIFEGIAVGLQTENDKIIEFALAIFLHEAVMAFSFGLEISKNVGMKKLTKIIYMLVFTSSIPVGIAIGLGLQNSPSDHQELSSAICEAFATGIFIHVIFIEIFAKEFPEPSSALKHDMPSTMCKSVWLVVEKILAVCAGFSLLIFMNVVMQGHPH